MTPFYIITGVSGSGKSTVGEQLAGRLDCPFYEGNDFHPPRNLAKMAAGFPLSDADHRRWLKRLHGLIGDHLAHRETAVMACNVLQKRDRDQLAAGHEGVQFIYLEGTFDLIWERWSARETNLYRAGMLRRQFEALERPLPAEGFCIEINRTIADIVSAIMQVITPR
jgi:gluconokinase